MMTPEETAFVLTEYYLLDVDFRYATNEWAVLRHEFRFFLFHLFPQRIISALLEASIANLGSLGSLARGR